MPDQDEIARLWFFEEDTEGGEPLLSGPMDFSDKVAEARFFLGKMESAEDLDEFRWLTSAFVCAARAALDWAAWCASSASMTDDGEPRRDASAIKVLSDYMEVKCTQTKGGSVVKAAARLTHPLLRLMSALRQESVHRSPWWISKMPQPADELLRRPAQRFIFSAPRSETVEAAQDLAVLPLCRKWLEVIEEIRERFP